MGSTPFAERLGILLLESTRISAGARTALLVLVGVMLVALGFLLACAWMIRKQSPASGGRRPRRDAARLGAELKAAVLAARRSGRKALADLDGAAVGCPTCRGEYDGGLQFCPRDARRLVPIAELDRSRRGGGICPRCRRAFDPGVRFCPHDATELLSVSLFEATSGREQPVTTGVIAKICPQCRSRHDLSASFCGKDGSELAVLN